MLTYKMQKVNPINTSFSVEYRFLKQPPDFKRVVLFLVATSLSKRVRYKFLSSDLLEMSISF